MDKVWVVTKHGDVKGVYSDTTRAINRVLTLGSSSSFRVNVDEDFDGSVGVSNTFADYKFKSQMFRELKVQIMEELESFESDRVPSGLQLAFQSMLDVESRYSW